MKKRIALYAGSFDPFTNGHHEIVVRGLELFDEIIVLVAVSGSKSPLFSMEERVSMIREIYKNHQNIRIDFHEGLLVDYAKKVGASFLLRGLRPTGDFDYEYHMAAMNHELAPQIESVFFVTHKEQLSISSSAVREILKCGGDVSKFVPREVCTYLKSRG